MRLDARSGAAAPLVAPTHEAATAAEEKGSAPQANAARLTSQGYVSWIWPRPARREPFLGYVRVGGSVALRPEGLVPGPGCPGGYYAVAPRGYVCNDRTVTLTPSPRFADAARATAPAKGPLPYRYAISNGAPMYNRLPTAAEQARFERPFGPAGVWQPLPKTLASHEELATAEPIAPAGDIPPPFGDGAPADPERLGLVRQTIPLGSMLSFTRTFAAGGRTWLLSADLTLVPADRVRAFRPSTFRGVRLGAGEALPLAWVRRGGAARHRLEGGEPVATSEAPWPARTLLRLTGARVTARGRTYFETTEASSNGAGPLYVAERDAAVAEAATKRPAGVAKGQKWILVRITQGTLVAYDDMTPVFATLASPGKGGVPRPGVDPVDAATTPLGTYYVTFKDRAATMSPERGSNRSFWIADVPHTQYFHPPFALHAAYWHDRFGEPTSAGCINLSPADAELLFDWSDPPVPEGWQGATGSGAKENGPTTAVVVRR